MPSLPRWLPNAISALRIALVPVWLGCAEAANRVAERADPSPTWRAFALALLLTIGVSDVIDGQLARRFGLQSRVGALLDAVADKLAQIGVFTYLALRLGPAFAPVPLWFLALLIARDAVLLSGYGLLLVRHGRVHVEHHAHGKLTSLLLFASALTFSSGAAAANHLALLVPIATCAIASMLLYARDGWRQWSAACPPHAEGVR